MKKSCIQKTLNIPCSVGGSGKSRQNGETPEQSKLLEALLYDLADSQDRHGSSPKWSSAFPSYRGCTTLERSHIYVNSVMAVNKTGPTVSPAKHSIPVPPPFWQFLPEPHLFPSISIYRTTNKCFNGKTSSLKQQQKHLTSYSQYF